MSGKRRTCLPFYPHVLHLAGTTLKSNIIQFVQYLGVLFFVFGRGKTVFTIVVIQTFVYYNLVNCLLPPDTIAWIYII